MRRNQNMSSKRKTTQFDEKNHKTPAWIKAGIVMANAQEPLTFLRRRGNLEFGADIEHFNRFSDEKLKKLKLRGVNLIMLSGMKGAGRQAEAEDIEYSKKAAQRCHRLGLKVGTYIGDTLLAETLFQEIPEAATWSIVNAYGEPCHYHGQSFRFKACRNNPGYLNFLKDATRMCIEEIGADFLHYDNMYQRSEPNCCRCDHCQGLFKEFVRNKYSPNQFFRRYGFNSPDFIKSPEVIRNEEPWRSPAIIDPLAQDWIDFQCESLALSVGKLSAYARSLKPDVVIECNPTGLSVYNPALFWGVDHQRFLPCCDIFWSEVDSRNSGITPEGDLQSRIRSYKLAQSFNQILFTNLSKSSSEIGNRDTVNIAESMAFNPLSMVGVHLCSARNTHIFDFWRKNKDLFTNTEPLIDVALFHQFETLTFFPDKPVVQTQLAEQTLIQAHIPWQMIFDKQLPSAGKYRALVLPEVFCLSDQQVSFIREKVQGGLGLVVTGATSSRDHTTKSRGKLVLGDLWDETGLDYNQWGIARKNKFGKGRVAYLPQLELRRPVLPHNHYGYLLFGSWQLPANWREFAEAVKWVAGGVSIEVDAPITVVAEFRRQPLKGRILVHLVNYVPEQEVQNIRIKLAKSLVSDTPKVSLLTYESVKIGAVSRILPDGRFEITVNWLGQYGLVIVDGCATAYGGGRKRIC